jgi:hypothetical protein
MAHDMNQELRNTRGERNKHHSSDPIEDIYYASGCHGQTDGVQEREDNAPDLLTGPLAANSLQDCQFDTVEL